eukprot:8203161-Lingulodinium_polyedra.AAC.2
MPRCQACRAAHLADGEIARKVSFTALCPPSKDAAQFPKRESCWSGKFQASAKVQGSERIEVFSGGVNPLAQPRDCSACEALEFMEPCFFGCSLPARVRKELTPWMSDCGSLTRHLQEPCLSAVQGVTLATPMECRRCRPPMLATL